MFSQISRRAAGLALASLAGLGLAAVPAHAQTTAFTFTGGFNRTPGDYKSSLGYNFTTGATPIVVSALGYYAHSGALKESHTVGIFDTSGNLLTSVTVPQGTTANADGFAFAADAYALLPGTTYIIGANTGVTDADAFVENSTSSPAAGSGLTTTTGRYYSGYNTDNGATLIFPDTTVGEGGYFGPDFQIAAAPEPSQTAALGLGALGLGGLVLAGRRRVKVG